MMTETNQTALYRWAQEYWAESPSVAELCARVLRETEDAHSTAALQAAAGALEWLDCEPVQWAFAEFLLRSWHKSHAMLMLNPIR